MIAVIVPPAPMPDVPGLDAEHPLGLLPLGDRPVLQHIIESLVSQGIKSIEVIWSHAPEKVEALLGNGDRWGCSFRYHLAAQPDHPYRSLKVIERVQTEPWVLVHADRFPCVRFPTDAVTQPKLYMDAAHTEQTSYEMAQWGGTAVFPAGGFAESIANCTFAELRGRLVQRMRDGEAAAETATEWIDASTPGALLRTQAKLLGGRLSGLMISGIERQPGIWISRNVEVHPTATLTPPLYIGANCRINRGARLGPDVVIGAGCLIDSRTTMERSLALGGTYIGEGLELNDAIVNHNLLLNVRLGTTVNIADNFLLGGLEQRLHEGWLHRGLESLLACLIILVSFPLLLLSILYYALTQRIYYTSVPTAATPLVPLAFVAKNCQLPCLGADAWASHRAAGWTTFFRQFLPGLFAVLLGRVSLVGLPPRNVQEIEQLPAEWQALYRSGRAGLITEASVVAADASDETHLYLADAYYSAKRSLLYDMRLALQYLLRLVLPARRQRQISVQAD